MTDTRTTYERATSAYDEDHERALVEAITTAIFESSRISDCNALVVRTGETAAALLTVLVGLPALSPAVTRSPTAIRKTADEIGKRLRRRVARAEQHPDVQDFLRRAIRSSDVGGNA